MQISGGHTKGKSVFDDPGEAWDFKMRKQLDGAKVKMWEKTTDLLGVKVLCDPRIIYVTWTY